MTSSKNLLGAGRALTSVVEQAPKVTRGIHDTQQSARRALAALGLAADVTDVKELYKTVQPLEYDRKVMLFYLIAMGTPRGLKHLRDLRDQAAHWIKDDDVETLAALDQAERQATVEYLSNGIDPTQLDGTFTSPVDGKQSAVEISGESIAAYRYARAVYQNACKAAGGSVRLKHLMEWFALDPDLKAIILEEEGE